MQYLVLFAIVFGVNLLPAFGPPTWTLLVFARITGSSDLRGLEQFMAVVDRWS
jgi:hypothetical protein